MHVPGRLLAGFRSRPRAHLALAFAVASAQVGTVLAAAPAATVVSTDLSPVTVACSHVADAPGQCKAIPDGAVQTALPPGMDQCADSATGAACSGTNPGSSGTPSGTPSTPEGMTACPSAAPLPSTVAACSDTVISTAEQPAPAVHGAQPTSLAVAPSVPMASLQGGSPTPAVVLSADAPTVQLGQKVTLTATSTSNVTGSNRAIEVLDRATGAVIGACAQGGQCVLTYSASAGRHTLVAYLGAPAPHPAPDAGAWSNPVDVSWFAVRLDATSGAVVGPGKALTVTASSTAEADRASSVLQIYDSTTRARLTYCVHGTSCSTSLLQPASGPHWLVATLGKPSPSFDPQSATAVSATLQVTWLAVSISGSTTGRAGGSVYLTAVANADVKDSPWSIGIFNEQGVLVGPPCKSGVSCSAQLPFDVNGSHQFSAAIGAVPSAEQGGAIGQMLMQRIVGPTQLINVQARSGSVLPTRMLWGVDSCKSFADDVVGNGLYLGTAEHLGWPDFWGRYLTNTICPGLSGTEIAVAHKYHFGILPIYNDYNCSNVVGYDTGVRYAWEAVGAAQSLGIPYGIGLAVDVEPPGDACPGAANVEAGFVQGWFDGIRAAHYIPVFYGNGTGASEFASAWCGAINARPEMANGSFLWSFEPNLGGDYSKAGAPGYTPYTPGCPGTVAAWQYQIGSLSRFPDVDQDEASSSLPLWYP